MTNAADFAEMALALAAEPDVEETLSSVCEYAKVALPCDYVGIHIVRNRQIETGAATDPLVEHADKLQMEYDEGPCLDAIWNHDSFIVHDAATDTRWPSFGPAAANMGLHSILSIRLFTYEQTLGALNLYSADVREFSPDDVALGHVFGRHASVAFGAARKEEGLRQAIDARHLIGQAQGILMERFGLSERQAFSVLRRYSQDKNIKLRAVAEGIITTRELPGSGGITER
jgi:GAF domain-containing protein